MADKKLVEPRTLKGFNDLMPEQALLKRRMTSSLVRTFEAFGFCTIETPHLEFTEVLIGDASAEIQKQLFRFTDQGGRDVTLRFDLTVPLARYISQYKGALGLPFKRYVIGGAFRGEKPQKGRYREFTQCDFDFLGATGLGCDAEILQVVRAGLLALKVERFCIRINNRHIMNGFAQWLKVEDKTAAMIQAIDKIDKISAAGVYRELTGEIGFTNEQAQAVIDFVALTPDTVRGVGVVASCEHPALTNAEFALGIAQLCEVCERLTAVGVPAQQFRADFSIARGLGYYTGTVFETNLEGLPEYGSVCSGGRYDNLTQTFQKEEISGIGGSFGLDRLIAALQEGSSKAPARSPADLLVITGADSAERAATRVGAYLRDTGGLNVDVFPEVAKIKKQLSYAERSGINLLVFVRDDAAGDPQSVVLETRDGTVKKTCNVDAQLIAEIRGLLAK